MKTILTQAIRADREYTQLLETAKKQFKAPKPLPLLINGLCEGAADAAILSLLSDLPRGRCALIVCSEEKDCVRLNGMLKHFGVRSAFYVGRDFTYYNITASHEYEHERLDVLFGLLDGALDAVVTTPDAALGYTIPPQRLENAVLHLDFDSRIDLDDLAGRLVAAGYSRADMVDGKGQFAIRGGIVDIYPPNGHYTDEDGQVLDGSMALRIELFDDEVDRMGLFDVDSQRIHTNVQKVDLPPAREILLDNALRDKLKKAISAQFKTQHDEAVEEALIKEAAAVDRSMESGCDVPFADKYISLIYPEKNSIFDYFSERSPVFLIGTNNIYERLRASVWHNNQTVQELVSGGTIAPKYAEYTKPMAAFDIFCEQNVTMHVDSMSYGLSGRKLSGMFGFRSKNMVSYGDNFNLLEEDLASYLSQNYRVVLLAENEINAKNLCGLLNDHGIKIALSDPDGELSLDQIPKGSALVAWGQNIAGFELVTPRIALLSTCADSRRGTLTSSGKIKSSKKKKSASQAIMSYADLEVGDFVVHENYGIGRYTGIETMTISGITRDYIGIQYAGSDKLFLPTEKLDKVSKYIGSHADDGMVKLSKFGGDSWNKTKARTRASVKDIAKDLIRLYAERERRPGFAFPHDDEFQKSFEAAFEYEETEGQLRASDDVKRDMVSTVPMDRLLCGDVGFGKTEVALRAAYKAVLGGKQVAVLVPTTILALQHYQTFTSRMRAFGVNVDMISRFRTAKEQSLTLRRLKRGEVDVLIGTHRLIGKDVDFHDLGLLIVDEEQRFGVAQKEKLKQMAGNVDVLTLSATPIPRTLNMAMGGLRDISVLDEAPGDRLPVQTYVLEEDELIIHEAIRRELRRGGQVFYLHNIVETIDDVAAKLSREMPDARITVAHGKMEKDVLERIWEHMLSGEIDILVCTTIIETGVDVANANTLIVDNAHRLGLSQLHQLRGRVGRSSRRAYAYFTYPKFKALPEIAQKRLEAIRDYAEFGAGFKIALRDMEIRGAGNLLGSEQHGHMDAVGYDLYIKLLNEAVLTEKGEAPKPEPECTITVHFDAYIPDKYVPYPSQRMEMYKKIAMIDNEQDRDDILDEMLDRFGDLPRATENLLNIALIRADGKRCGIKQIRQENEFIQFYPEKIDFDVWTDLSELWPGRLRMAMSGEPHLNLKMKSGEDALPFIHKMFEKYTEFAQKNNG
ncbi:MAG: transcription-repair coupling factor [Ruminococcaceae bacterium]|nr:transcription-repair coupling factor [Oscillospiraceae bacterium]